MQFERYPGNPFLLPNPAHEWESVNVFNAAVVQHVGLYHMLYRAQGRAFCVTGPIISASWGRVAGGNRSRWGSAARRFAPLCGGCWSTMERTRRCTTGRAGPRST
jgi:hypothetical protein